MLSAARLIDNAVEINFAQANLGSQMRRLRARCKRNRPLPRRDGANLLPLGMKADLSPPLIVFLRASPFLLFFSPCTRTPSPDPCTLTYLLFSSFSPFNLSVRAYRAENAKPRINTKYKGTTNTILYLPLVFTFSLLLSLIRGKLSRFPPSHGNLLFFFFTPVFGIVRTNEAFQRSISGIGVKHPIS